jgi:hypothetical protein
VCRFHVAAGAKLHPGRGVIYKFSRAVVKLASINLQKLVLSPTGSINLGLILSEDLLLCSSYLPLGVPNWAVIYTPSVAQPGGGPRHPMVRLPSGPPSSLLWTPSSCQVNRKFGFHFIQFQEYFLCNFSETQKQQKTGN